MLAYLNQNIKFQAEIPLTDLDNEDGRAEADQFITDCDPRGLENHVLKNIRLGVLHNCLDTMAPRSGRLPFTDTVSAERTQLGEKR